MTVYLANGTVAHMSESIFAKVHPNSIVYPLNDGYITVHLERTPHVSNLNFRHVLGDVGICTGETCIPDHVLDRVKKLVDEEFRMGNMPNECTRVNVCLT